MAQAFTMASANYKPKKSLRDLEKPRDGYQGTVFALQTTRFDSKTSLFQRLFERLSHQGFDDLVPQQGGRTRRRRAAEAHPEGVYGHGPSDSLRMSFRAAAVGFEPFGIRHVQATRLTGAPQSMAGGARALRGIAHQESWEPLSTAPRKDRAYLSITYY